MAPSMATARGIPTTAPGVYVLSAFVRIMSGRNARGMIVPTCWWRRRTHVAHGGDGRLVTAMCRGLCRGVDRNIEMLAHLLRELESISVRRHVCHLARHGEIGHALLRHHAHIYVALVGELGMHEVGILGHLKVLDWDY